MVTVVWISRHMLIDENIVVLNRAFGMDIKIKIINKTVTEKTLKKIVKRYGKDVEYVVVLPPHLIQVLLDEGVRVYKFITVRNDKRKKGEVDVKPIGLEQIKELEWKTERIV